MLAPKKTKFRKFHRRINFSYVKRKGSRSRGILPKSSLNPKTDLVFGFCGIKALEPVKLHARCIEAARRAMTRRLKRSGKIWIRVFPSISVSAKPNEIRMGKGKGPHSFWAAFVRPGQVLFEIDRVPLKDAKHACELASAKLPIRTAFIQKK
jgi:large subunit ribosomal protein L16